MPPSPQKRDGGRSTPLRARRLLAWRNALALLLAAATGALGAVVVMPRNDAALVVVAAAAAVTAGAWLVSVRRVYVLFEEVFGPAGAASPHIDLTLPEHRGPHRVPAGTPLGRRIHGRPAAAVEEGERAAHRRRIRAVLEAGNSLNVVFQPIVDLSSTKVIGFEAFSRFADGQPPDRWFAEAHAIGMGVELEMLAVNRAVDHRPPTGYLSVNVSPQTLASDAFVEFISDESLSDLVIEMTEHVGVDDYAVLAESIELVHQAGLRLAVDDAGSGYASMRHVLTLQPDIIKLDRSLVATIDSDTGRQELVSSLSSFASRTRATVVAEGIERAEEADMCHRVGVHCGQGYYFGRPSPSPGAEDDQPRTARHHQTSPPPA